MRKIEPISAYVPYMTNPGNHEFLFNFEAYKHRFYMPSYDATSNMYYSVTINDIVHLCMTNTESVIDTAEISNT